ncbi:hypothetical protein ACHAW5_005021 [Stephanodiscus triporus]|uniref:Uncharacterized protein n=1 Tax=Stephanodiscus triporus TaxID=2934178 RepID=A0ABD3NNR0_9STRA
MSFLHNACVKCALLSFLRGALAYKIIDGTASPGNYIVSESYNSKFTSSDGGTTIDIVCNVPITIQRYSDDLYMEGMQPVGPADVKVLVTSDCAANSNSTPYVPRVTWGDGSVEIIVDGAPPTPPLRYLDSSSYHATWSYENGWCRSWQGQSDGPTPAPPEDEGGEIAELAVEREIVEAGDTDEDKKPRRTTTTTESPSPCNVNVEVLLDACSRDANVSAPMVRVIDAVLNGTDQREDPDDKCVTDLEADILFDESRAYRLIEWTRNALGEHASVASFSAFAIALMTNQAPSDLVEDALGAALDEVRHARTSFGIASRLTGREVRPGALPASEHVFHRDLKAMAMAVAREGCVDETLSALEAAAEVNFIERVLADGADGTKYSSIDRDVLAWIGKELQIIASDERNHAALAWRTLKWLCSIDSHACEDVKAKVLNEDALEEAFRLRFASFRGQTETLEAMTNNWRMIYTVGIDFEAHQKACAYEQK